MAVKFKKGDLVYRFQGTQVIDIGLVLNLEVMVSGTLVFVYWQGLRRSQKVPASLIEKVDHASS